ncbi:hypothetical protein IKF15_04430 [Candidatus Saccharibacteria bacterium]|nr:hypothetical protein [Candidatus Saccharibacteria bacterium]
MTRLKRLPLQGFKLFLVVTADGQKKAKPLLGGRREKLVLNWRCWAPRLLGVEVTSVEAIGR